MNSERQIRRALQKERDDVQLAGYAPKEVRKFLIRFGGLNPHGEANYRLVLAQCVLLYHGGRFHDWDPNTSAEQQGGLMESDETEKFTTEVKTPSGIQKIVAEVPKMMVNPTKPLRIVDEMRWVQRFPQLEGWLLQHWDPPSMYGDKDAWERPCVPGKPHLPLLGPFPSTGRYENTAEWFDPRGKVGHATFEKIPSLNWLQNAIESRERDRNKDVSANRGWRMLTASIELQHQIQKEAQKRQEHLTQIYRDRIKPIFGSSLAAGRLRERLAARARESGVILGHVGN